MKFEDGEEQKLSRYCCIDVMNCHDSVESIDEPCVITWTPYYGSDPWHFNKDDNNGKAKNQIGSLNVRFASVRIF